MRRKLTLGLMAAAALLLSWGAAVVYRNNKDLPFFYDSRVREKPNEQVFVGRWHLDDVSRASVFNRTARKPASPELLLRADGTVLATDMPYEEMAWKREGFSLISEEGHWRLEKNVDWALVINFKGMRTQTYNIQIRGGQVVAFDYPVGDPDSNELWIWRKAP